MGIFSGIFALLISIGCFWASIRMLKVYYNVKRWQQLKARVISKEITIHEKFLTTRTPYKLSVKYTYLLNGMEYNGNKVYLVELLGGQANHTKKDANRKLDKIMGFMPIYVDPSDPKNCVMYCDGVGLYYFIFIMGLFTLFFGLTKFI